MLNEDCVLFETVWSSFCLSLSTAMFHFNQCSSVVFSWVMLTKDTNSRWTWDKTVQGNICFRGPGDPICEVTLCHPCQLPLLHIPQSKLCLHHQSHLTQQNFPRKRSCWIQLTTTSLCLCNHLQEWLTLLKTNACCVHRGASLILGKYCSLFAKSQG